jgi:hypothetical protein
MAKVAAALDIAVSAGEQDYPAEYNGPREIQDVILRTPVRPVKGKFVLGDARGALDVVAAALTTRAAGPSPSRR